jgi:RNA polymerase sigma-70 factor (ECF subfamily)
MELNSVFSISSGDLAENRDALAPILAKARAGNEAAFGEIYNLYFKKIYQFIYYRVGHKEVAEDLAEEVFLKAFAKISSVLDDNSFVGWLYQIARNIVIDYYRQKKNVVALEDVENTLEYETNVIDIVNLESQQKVLLKLLKELGAEQQIVLKLKFFEDLTNSEIAEMLHKNEGAVRVIQHRAIVKLQELLKKLKGNE